MLPRLKESNTDMSFQTEFCHLNARTRISKYYLSVRFEAPKVPKTQSNKNLIFRNTLLLFPSFFAVGVPNNLINPISSCQSHARNRFWLATPVVVLLSSILHVASESVDLFGSRSKRPASVAQLAERLICNQQVAGSSPAASSRRSRMETVRRTSVCGLVRRSDADTGRRLCLPTEPATHWARSIQYFGKKKMVL